MIKGKQIWIIRNIRRHDSVMRIIPKVKQKKPCCPGAAVFREVLHSCLPWQG